MTPDELVASFERCTLPPERFRHAEHVEVAWVYLQRMPIERALDAFATSLRRYAARQGAEAKYHQTLTWGWMLLVHERLERTGRGASWDDFRERNADLFDRDYLARYYRTGTLQSPLARRVFVMPDVSC